LIATFAGAIAAIGGVKLARSFGSFFQSAVASAAHTEANRVTFDALLGDKGKSKELMSRITSYSAATPFQRSDLIEGSKMLLNVTKDNLDENEKLFKLSANIAALRPGKKVAEVSRGIVNATVGEFDILKSSFGLVLRAEQFKKYGTPGGKAYSEAVIKEIQRQFTEKTGGADLVGELSKTLQGKVSTLIDNLDILRDYFGEKMIEIFDIKEVVDVLIKGASDFIFAFRGLMGEGVLNGTQDMARWMDIHPFIKDLAFFTVEGMKKLEMFVSFTKHSVIKPLYDMFSNLSEGVRQAVIGIGFSGLAASLGTGIIVPTITMIGLVFSALVAVLSPLSSFIIPGIVAGIGALLGILPSGGIVGIFGVGFAVFRKDGESVATTFKRMAWWLTWFKDSAVAAMKAFWTPFIKEVMPVVKENFGNTMKALNELKVPLQEFFAQFTGQRVTSIKDFAILGKELGIAFGKFLAWNAEKAVKWINRLTAVLKFAQSSGFFQAYASDIINLGKSFFGLLTGADRSTKSLKTFMLALADVVTNPFRLIIVGLIDMLDGAFKKLQPIVAAFSTDMAEKIGSTIESLKGMKETIKEGFLKTNIPIGLEVEPFEDTLSVEIDGEKVAETTRKRDMRARHGGRGGNPVNPEELGFVLTSGGAGIKVVTSDQIVEEL